MQHNETPEGGFLQPKHVAGILEKKSTYGYSAAGPTVGLQVVQYKQKFLLLLGLKTPTLQPTTLN